MSQGWGVKLVFVCCIWHLSCFDERQEDTCVKKLDVWASKNWTVGERCFWNAFDSLNVTFLARRLLSFCHDECTDNDQTRFVSFSSRLPGFAGKPAGAVRLDGGRLHALCRRTELPRAEQSPGYTDCRGRPYRRLWWFPALSKCSVSYTHLTLPTKRIV